MRLSDVKNLIFFNTRMGMFICPSSRVNVVAFLHGYEFCAGQRCRFTQSLSDAVARRYRIKPDSIGWPHQIERLGQNLSLKWMDVYLLVSSEVLQKELSPAGPTNRRAK